MAEHQYEREIDELLKRLESEHRDPLPFRPRRRTPPWSAGWQRLGGVLGIQSTVERLMLLAVALLLGTFFLGFFAPALARAVGVLAVGCFVGALAVSVWSGAQNRGASYHRHGHAGPSSGRTVDWDRLVWRLRGWLRRFRR